MSHRRSGTLQKKLFFIFRHPQPRLATAPPHLLSASTTTRTTRTTASMEWSAWSYRGGWLRETKPQEEREVHTASSHPKPTPESCALDKAQEESRQQQQDEKVERKTAEQVREEQLTEEENLHLPEHKARHHRGLKEKLKVLLQDLKDAWSVY
ncbi:hypothetical protein QOT17_011238 [Balamuthia mandrillaris]